MGNQNVQNGISWAEIAKSAYLAYSASTGNKNFRGEEMPDFEDLPEAIRVAWECAVRQTKICLEVSGPKIAGNLNEEQWTNWTLNKLKRSGEIKQIFNSSE